MQQIFDLASVALFDLLVIASNRGATCHVASHQEDDVEAEGDVHDSVPHDVGVDQEHQQDQRAASGSGSSGGKFNEGHDSLLGSREHVNDAVCSHAEADEAQDEDEEGHGGSVRVVVEQNVEDHIHQHGNADEGDENSDEVFHGLRLCLLLAALGLFQLRPDFLPVSRAQLLKARTSVDPVQPARELRGSRLQTVEDLVEVLLVDIEHLCNLMPTFRGVVWECHAEHSMHGLEHVK